MHWLDLTLPTPAENLACDEALLDLGEAGGGEILRVWEAPTAFVVVGYANRVAAEVNVPACAAAAIPILRRCSGGGTVLQGPGCLSYSLVLQIDAGGPLHSIPATNRSVMERNRAALESALHANLKHQESAVAIRGHTDLTLGNLKFSGNAQRRKKRCLLFHGTFLLHFDLPQIERCLPMPSRQPGYRGRREHRNFLVNLGLPAATVKRALQEAWNAFHPLDPPPRETIASLTRDKYATSAWNLKF
jgi:lipoate---protein ligase